MATSPAKKLKIVKATAVEIAEHHGTYPLYGFIINPAGLSLKVEDLRPYWDKENPQWEVLAPKGKIFDRVCLHTMLAHDHADLRDRVGTYELIDCDIDGCTCGEDDED